MIVLCEIFEYDKISKEYRASELGRKMGFSTRKINERLYFVANEDAAKSAHFRMGDAFLVVLFWMITCFPHPNAAKMVKEVHTLKGVIIMGKK